MLHLINVQLTALKRAAIKASQMAIMSGIGLGIGSAIFFNLLRRFVRTEDTIPLPSERECDVEDERDDVECSQLNENLVEIPSGELEGPVLSSSSISSLKTFASLSPASTSSSQTDSFLSASSSHHAAVDAQVSEIQVQSLPELLLSESSSSISDSNPQLIIKDSYVVMVMHRKAVKEVVDRAVDQKIESSTLSRSDENTFDNVGFCAKREDCRDSFSDEMPPESPRSLPDVPQRHLIKYGLYGRRRRRSCHGRISTSNEAPILFVGSPEGDDVEDVYEENWREGCSRESVHLSRASTESSCLNNPKFHRAASSISENDLSSLYSSGTTSGNSNIKGSISYTANPSFINDVWSFSIATNSGCSSILGMSPSLQQRKTGSEVVEKMAAIEVKLRLIEKEAMEVKKTFEKIRKSEAGVAKLCFVTDSDDLEFCAVNDEDKSVSIDSSCFCHDPSSLSSPQHFSDILKDHDHFDLSTSLNLTCPMKRHRTSTPQCLLKRKDQPYLFSVLSNSAAPRITEHVLLDEDVHIGSTTFQNALDWNFEDVLGNPADVSISF